MNNTMVFGDYLAVINYDADIEMFRGEFLSLNGGADFYAKDIQGLKEEGQKSLNEFLKICKERGINPKKLYSGELRLKISPQLHEKIATLANIKHKSLDSFINETLIETFSY